ncbi:nucleotidyltransferase domain-containing protein [bacterium]|nr:nucleotidyltransferase domain-containing protein [bacterium]
MLNVSEEELRRLCRRWRIERLSLFGSVSKGESGPLSDVDLLVEFEEGTRITLLDFVNIRYELGNLFNKRIDLISKRGLLNSGNEMRREEIIRTARTIYEKVSQPLSGPTGTPEREVFPTHGCRAGRPEGRLLPVFNVEIKHRLREIIIKFRH